MWGAFAGDVEWMIVLMGGIKSVDLMDLDLGGPFKTVEGTNCWV